MMLNSWFLSGIEMLNLRAKIVDAKNRNHRTPRIIEVSKNVNRRSRRIVTLKSPISIIEIVDNTKRNCRYQESKSRSYKNR